MIQRARRGIDRIGAGRLTGVTEGETFVMWIETSWRKALLTLTAMLAIAAFAGCGSKSDNSGATGAAASQSDATQSNETGSTGGSSTANGGTGSDSGDEQSTGGTSSAGSDSKPVPADTKGTEPPPVQLLAGDLSGVFVSRPKVIISRTEKQWTALQKRIFSHGVEQRSAVGTDFNTRQVVGIFMPKQPPGTLTDITGIRQQKGKIIVYATRIRPGKGCKHPAYKTRPFHIVDTRQMAGKPVVVLETILSSPC